LFVPDTLQTTSGRFNRSAAVEEPLAAAPASPRINRRQYSDDSTASTTSTSTTAASLQISKVRVVVVVGSFHSSMLQTLQPTDVQRNRDAVVAMLAAGNNERFNHSLGLFVRV
jgi:hypothetical protein